MTSYSWIYAVSARFIHTPLPAMLLYIIKLHTPALIA